MTRPWTLALTALAAVAVVMGAGGCTSASGEGTAAAETSTATPAATAAPRTFYVSPRGNDTAAGTSPARAWRTVERVNEASLRPGDTVLFQGGALFAGTTLIPPASGTASRPIRFGSFGRGLARIVDPDGAVWIPGRRFLALDRLWLSSGSGTSPVVGGAAAAPSSDVVVTRSVISGGKGPGIISPATGDSRWRITCNTVADVGDSGIIIVGSGFVVRGNLIRNTGWNDAIDYGKHGIYAKGPAPVITQNVIETFRDNGVSLRGPNSRVQENTISGGPIAIAFYDESTDVGHSYVVGNTAYDIERAGFYFAPDQPAPGQAPSERFTVTGNTFRLTSDGVGLDVSAAPPDDVTEGGNVTDLRTPASVHSGNPAPSALAPCASGA